MIQSTVDRLGTMCPAENVLVVTNRALVKGISAQLPDVPATSIIGEPAKRDTAPCVGLAAAWIAAMDPEAVMVVMPADHVITPDDVFQSAIAHAVSLVESDDSRLVTFGIKPDYPAEVFGYIERGKDIADSDLPTYVVERFREKPDAETAKQFFDAGTFYWNAGIFVWKAKTILESLRQFEPEMMQHIDAIAATIGSKSFPQTLESEFTAIRGTSIDYAVMERHDNVVVVEAPFQWDDLGSWNAVPRQRGQDENHNTIVGRHLGIDTTNSIISTADDHLIATVGIDDLVVVHTPNATLIADRKNENGIKQVVAELESKEWTEFL